MYKQTRSPNLNAPARLGFCLEYVQNAYKAGWAGSSAWDAWSNRLKKKHSGTPPQNVYVPIWFDGLWNGQRLGHVSIYHNGKTWSSPYQAGQSHGILSSIAETERVYGMKYVGWSEDIGGTIVIDKGGNMADITKGMEDIMSLITTNAYPGANYDYRHVKKNASTTDLRVFLQTWQKRAQLAAAKKRIKELEAQVGGEYVLVTEQLYKKK